MKINKYFLTGLGFITGMVAGVSVIGLLSFTNGPSSAAPSGGTVKVTSAQAQSYCTGYQSGATPLNAVVKGFTVDRAQLDAMNSLSGENPRLSGFRVYFGRDNSANKVAIVVGVDDGGKDAVNGSIFSTDAPKASPCPPICDATSPIAGGN